MTLFHKNHFPRLAEFSGSEGVEVNACRDTGGVPCKLVRCSTESPVNWSRHLLTIHVVDGKSYVVLDWQAQSGFESVFGSTWRYIVGGTIAYGVSQYFDVWAFHFLKERFGGRLLCVRNNASTLVSQLIDTSIFVVIGFAGVAPLAPLIMGQFLLKALLAVFDTPFVYLGVAHLKKNTAIDSTGRSAVPAILDNTDASVWRT